MNEQGELYVWGTGIFGEILNPVKFSPSGVRFRSFSVGAFFGAAIEDTGKVWTWGSNANGELGLGAEEPQGKISQNTFFNEKHVENIACGGSFAIAMGDVVKPNHATRKASSPLRSQVQYTDPDITESPINKATVSIPVKIPRSVNVSYEIEAESVQESNPEKDAAALREKGLVRKANTIGNALRGSSVERPRSQMGKESRVYTRESQQINRGEDPVRKSYMYSA